MFNWIFVLTLLVTGCAHTQDTEFVKGRIDQLRVLSRYPGTQCQVQAQPTQPALARFRQLYPDVDQAVWDFKWTQTETRCDVKPLHPGPTVLRAQQSFLEDSLCVLAQAFYVNSPFDEKSVKANEVRRTKEGIEEWVQISKSPSTESGIWLSRNEFWIEARSPKQSLGAKYHWFADKDLLPNRMVHKSDNSQIVMDSIDYGEPVSSRKMLRRFDLLIGPDSPRLHTEVQIRDCRAL